MSSKKELLRELYVTQGEIFASFDGKKQTLEKNTGATSLDTILAILQSEAATSDEASEEMAERVGKPHLLLADGEFEGICLGLNELIFVFCG